MVDEVEYEKDEMAAVPPPRARYREMYTKSTNQRRCLQ
jgi:hypothetical protein